MSSEFEGFIAAAEADLSAESKATEGKPLAKAEKCMAEINKFDDDARKIRLFGRS